LSLTYLLCIQLSRAVLVSASGFWNFDIIYGKMLLIVCDFYQLQTLKRV